MGAAHNPTPSLFFARAVLLRHKTQVAGDLAGAVEAAHDIERRDKGTGRDRPDARQRHQACDHRIRCHKRFELRVGIGELVVKHFDDTAQRRKRGLH